MKKVMIAILVLSLANACGGGGRLREDPEQSFAYHYNLGMAAFDKQDYEEAIKHFKRSLRMNPNIARTHNELGMCYLFLSKFDDAITCFEKAISLDPRMAEAHNSLGVALYNKGKLREAEQQFLVVLSSEEYQTKFIPMYNLGNLYQKRGDYSKALEYYNDAIKDDNNVSLEYKIYIHYQTGNTQLELKNYKEAFKEFDQTVVLNPLMTDAVLKAGISAFYIGDFDNARRYLERVISNEPNSSFAKDAKSYLDKMKK